MIKPFHLLLVICFTSLIYTGYATVKGTNELDHDDVLDSPAPRSMGMARGSKKKPTPVTNVEVHPSTTILLKDKTLQFTATVRGQDTPSQDVIWTLTGAKSSETEINSNGLLTIGYDETATLLTVKAYSQVDPSRNATAKVRTSLSNNNINLIVGFGVTGLQNPNDTFKEPRAEGGANIGVSHDVRFGNLPFLVEPGIRYITKGIDYSKNYVYNLTASSQDTFHFIDIYTKAKAEFPPNGINTLQPYIGYALSILTNAKGSAVILTDSINIDTTEDCNRLVHNLLLGIDYVIYDKLSIGAEYDIGLSNIWKKGLTEAKISTVILNVGLKF